MKKEQHRCCLLALAVLATQLSSACNPATPPRPASSAPAGELARIGDKAITAEDFRAKLGELSPLVRARYDSLERKNELLDGLVRFELLLQEARRRGLERDPEVQATLEKIMVQRLLSQVQELTPAPDEAAARKHYADHLSEYLKPERIRVRHLFLASPTGDSGRGQTEEEARKLLASIKALEAARQTTAFADQAMRRSDDLTSRENGGDQGFKTRQELVDAWGEPVAEEAWQLTVAGSVGGLVATERGFHLVKLESRQPGVELSFDAVRKQIEGQLAMGARAANLDGFMNSLRTSTKVTIDQTALQQIEVTQAPASSR